MKNRLRKKTWLTAGTAAIAVVLAMTGCASSSSSTSSTASVASVDLTSGPEIDLTFWHSMGGTNADALNTMIEQFNTKYEGHIKVTAQYQGDYDTAINKFKNAMVAKSGPDILQSYELGTRYLIDSGFVQPVQDYIDSTKWDIKQLDTNIAAYYTVNKKLYSMPFNSSTPILYYNKDEFKEAGLDVDNPPETFQEIIEDSAKLTKKDASGNVTQNAIGMYVYGWFLDQSLNKMSLTSFNNGNGRTKAPTAVSFDSNGGALEFLNVYKELITSGAMPSYAMKSTDAKTAFVNGKLSMYIDSTASLAGLLKSINGSFELGTGYFPAVSDKYKSGGVSIGGASLWMMKDSDERKQAAKWEFIKFMVSSEQQAYWNTQTGYFPVNVNSYNETTFKENVAKYPQFQTAIDQLHDSSKSSVGALCGIYTQARKIEETEMQNALNGQITTQEAVSNMASQINSALKDYNDANA